MQAAAKVAVTISEAGTAHVDDWFWRAIWAVDAWIAPLLDLSAAIASASRRRIDTEYIDEAAQRRTWCERM